METQFVVTNEVGELTALYKMAFPAVARLIHRYGGDLEDAKDVFHDALLTWFEMPEENREKISDTKAYLFIISRNNWFRKIEKLEKEREAATHPQLEDVKISDELYHLLITAGKKCMTLLQAFYYEKTPAEKIAVDNGLSGAHSASVQKYKCLEKLRAFVKKNHFRKEDFYEN